MCGVTQYQARRHPVASGIMFLILGPLILAAGLLAVLVWAVAGIIRLAFGR